MKQQHFYCFRLPHLEHQPVSHYQNHTGEFVITTAVSQKQAASHAIVKRFKQYGDVFKNITKYLHASFTLTDFVFDIDEADKPIRQLNLFEKPEQSHRRLNEVDISNKIAKRYNIPNDGENSIPRRISRDYIQYRRENSLKQ